MFNVQRPKQEAIVVIRAATAHELSAYEKHKLAHIEENAQENKIESIRVNDEKLKIDPVSKEVKIELGNLAFKQEISSNDLSSKDLFLIECGLEPFEANDN